MVLRVVMLLGTSVVMVLGIFLSFLMWVSLFAALNYTVRLIRGGESRSIREIVGDIWQDISSYNIAGRERALTLDWISVPKLLLMWHLFHSSRKCLDTLRSIMNPINRTFWTCSLVSCILFTLLFFVFRNNPGMFLVFFTITHLSIFSFLFVTLTMFLLAANAVLHIMWIAFRAGLLGEFFRRPWDARGWLRRLKNVDLFTLYPDYELGILWRAYYGLVGILPPWSGPWDFE